MMDIEELQGGIIDRVGNYNRHRQYAIAEALEAGRMLNEARDILPHGEWTPFVESCGLKTRTARRWMVVAESGLQIGQVAAFGGLEFTARLWRTLSHGKDSGAVRELLQKDALDWELLALNLPYHPEIAELWDGIVGYQSRIQNNITEALRDLAEGKADGSIPPDEYDSLMARVAAVAG